LDLYESIFSKKEQMPRNVMMLVRALKLFNYYFGLFTLNSFEFVVFLKSSNKSDWNLAWLSAILDNISVCARCSSSLSRAISTSSDLWSTFARLAVMPER